MKTSAVTTQLDLVPLFVGTVEGEAALRQLLVADEVIRHWRDQDALHAPDWPPGTPRWLPQVVTDFRTVLTAARHRVIWSAPEQDMPVLIAFFSETGAAVAGITAQGAEISSLSVGEACRLLAARIGAADGDHHDWRLGRLRGDSLSVRVRSQAGHVTFDARDHELVAELRSVADGQALAAALVSAIPTDSPQQTNNQRRSE